MSLNEEVELLRKIPLFAKIEPSKLKLLAFTSERLTYQNGQRLFQQGDIGDAAYIIIDGEASVRIRTDSGEIQVAELGKGDVVGEIAILCDVPRTASVEATGKLITLRITKELFFRLVSEFPQISIEIMRELAARLERTNVQLLEALNR
ncbi:cyclic nucleotide-binding domain-containing protein [Thalassobaculum sp. OXR-137]|jgi:CRP/FNR family transcriptional regulator, cyclic AMP receptor protein|uniref:cyclic nucleotide-binding domain-containing protein n=1 Tax=Thalassobaculum sp. OXR-137 TaxID=3100173 RepID=UPI002AC8B1DE|nr:cyclic nucleotide-binding domain-containing protein [Thalassobaculum sp. OXR-137]WPZ35411.1 cyclic nucleotide-binding domain-containing protein [Thalassobaculum sp. OXR-137]